MEYQLNTSNHNSDSIVFVNNCLDKISSKNTGSKTITLIDQGKQCYVLGDLSSEVNDLLRKAREIVQYGQKIDYSFLSKQNFEQKKNVPSEYFFNLTTQEKIEIGEKIIRKIERSLPDTSISIHITQNQSSIGIENSLGLKGQYHRTDYGIHTSITSCTMDDIYSVSRSLFNLQSPNDIDLYIENILRELEYYQNISQMSAGKGQLLMTSQFMIDEPFQVISQNFSKTLLENGTSPLLGKVNEKILSEKITLSEKGEYIPFDMDGVPVEAKKWIEKGILRRIPVLLESTNKLHLPATGSNFSGDFYSDLTLETGEYSMNHLIEQIEEGILLFNSYDIAQGSIVGGNLSGTVKEGLHIKNGKIIGRATGNSLSFNFFDAFGKNLTGIENKAIRTNGSSFMEMPSVLVKDVVFT